MKRRRAADPGSQSETGLKIPYYLLLLLAVALPLATSPYLLEDIFDLPKATLLRVVSLSLAGIWAYWVFSRGRIEWKRSPFDLPVAVLAFSAILATAFSYSPTSSLLGAVYKRHETLPAWLAYFLLFFAATNLLRRRERIQGFIKAIVLASILVALYGILQHFGYDPVSYQVSSYDRFRSFSTFGNAVFLGGYLVLVVPLALSLFVSEKDTRLKPLWMAVFFLDLVALAFTYTRGAWVGGTIALAIWLWLVLFRGRLLAKEGRKWIVVIAAVLLAVWLVVALTENVFPREVSLRERIVSAVELKGSTASRLSIWRTTVKAISLRPLLGWGPETQRLVTPALREKLFVQLEGASRIADRSHNQILHIAFSFGALGLFAYLWILVVFFLGLSRLRKTEPGFLLASGVFAGILGYLVQEQFAFSVIGVTPLFWLLLGANSGFLEPRNEANELRLGLGSMKWVVIAAIAVLVIVGMVFSVRLVAADYFYEKGIKAARAGDQYGSLESFRRANQLNPSEVRYLFSYGERAKNISLGERNLSMLNDVVLKYENALARYPADYDLYFGLGNAYFVSSFLGQRDDYSQARWAYARALKFEPYFVEAYVWLGKTYLAERNPQIQAALENLEAAIRISPGNVSALDALAQAYEKKGDRAKAISYLRQILTIDPNYRPAAQELERLEEASRK